MGCKFSNCEFTKTDIGDKIINLDFFKKIKVIGKGGFGRVWKVESKTSQEVMAMKVMSKVRVYEKGCVTNILNELELLARISHPFIIKANYAFNDKEYLYLLMDYLSGGDLRYYISSKFKFNEIQIKFMIACLIIALEFLHFNYIIHRDLKPENLIFDKDGYLHIGDLGISKLLEKSKEYVDTSGTPGYMAPEAINNLQHSFTSDYFSLGIILPYLGRTRKELRNEMISVEIKIVSEELPVGWSLECADFTNKLLKKSASDRIGAYDFQEIKSHSWFKNFDWENLYKKKLKAPFVPCKGDNFNARNANSIEPEIKNYQFILDMILKAKDFDGYYFNRHDLKTSRILESSGIKFLNPNDVKESKINILHKSNFKSLNSKSMGKYLYIDNEINRLDISSLYFKKNSLICDNSQYVRENVNKDGGNYYEDILDDSVTNIKKISIGFESIK